MLQSLWRFLEPIMVLALTLVLGLAPANTASSNSADGKEAFLQLTAGGHVLGFAQDGVYVAGMDRMLRVQFAGGNRVLPVTEGAVPAQNGAPPLSRITYSGVWPGVDVIYTAAEGGIIESTYHLEFTDQGLPVDSIRLRYNHPLSLDGQGNLVIAFENGCMLESAPRAWQVLDGAERPVTASFALHGEREIGFDLAGYLPGAPVVIDPVLTWNTFLGGVGLDEVSAIAVDQSGNIYVAGRSNAAWGSPVRAFTVNADYTDAFVAKLDNSGRLIWNTFLGASGDDRGDDIAVDGSGNVYVTGNSNVGWGNPVRAFTGGYDAFVARLNASSGALVWNTFLGGGGNDFGNGLAEDVSGDIYVAGFSGADWGSPVLPYTANYDAFTARLNGGSGALMWNTFLGRDGDDRATSIAVDGSGNVYVAGESGATWGSPVRPYTSDWDAFTARLDGGSGALVWNTFLGAAGSDDALDITVDGSGNVYVTGDSGSTWDSPVRPYTADGDAFTTRLDGGSGALVWNTFLGAAGFDQGRAITVDGSGNVYVTGYSATAWGIPVQPYTGNALAARLNGSNGALVWNAFLGGGSGEMGSAITVDGCGNVYVAGVGIAAWGNPVRVYTAGADGFAALVSDSSPAPIVSSATPASGQQGQSLNVTITGTPFTCTTAVSFGEGITVNSFRVNSTTQITASITIATNAAVGKRNVSVTARGGNLSLNNGFTVNQSNTTNMINVGQGNARPHGSAAPTILSGPVQLPSVSVQSVSLSSTKVAPGTPVTVTANVANTSTINGVTRITVYVNGREESSKGITVNSGSCTPITFNVSRSEPGAYSVYVGGTPAGSFTVDEFASPDLILYASITLLALAFFTGLLMMLRRELGGH